MADVPSILDQHPDSGWRKRIAERRRSECLHIQSNSQRRKAYSFRVDVQGSRRSLVWLWTCILRTYEGYGRVRLCKHRAHGQSIIVLTLMLALIRPPPTTRRQIYTSRPPYPTQPYGKGIMAIMTCRHKFERPTKIPDQLWDLLQLCRCYNPEDRYSMVAVGAALAKM